MIFNENNSTLRVGSKIWLEGEEATPFSVTIESLKLAGGKSCIKFTGCNAREEAQDFNGLTVSLPRSEFAALGEKEIYLVDLIGCIVLDEAKKSIGTVVDTMNLPAQNILVVEVKGNEVLIPFVDAHILLFDMKEKILIVKNVEGLMK